MTAFMLWWQSSVITTEIIWPTRPTIFTFWPYVENAWSLVKGILAYPFQNNSHYCISNLLPLRRKTQCLVISSCFGGIIFHGISHFQCDKEGFQPSVGLRAGKDPAAGPHWVQTFLRLAHNTVNMAKVIPRNQRARDLLMPSLCRHAGRNTRRKTPRSLSILPNFPRSALRGGNPRLGRRSLNLMKWPRQIRCAMIGKWRITGQLREARRRRTLMPPRGHRKWL